MWKSCWNKCDMYSLSSLVKGGFISSFTVVLDRSILTAARVSSVNEFESIDLLFDVVTAAAATASLPHCSVDLTSIFAYEMLTNNEAFNWLCCSRSRARFIILQNERYFVFSSAFVGNWILSYDLRQMNFDQANITNNGNVANLRQNELFTIYSRL